MSLEELNQALMFYEGIKFSGEDISFTVRPHDSVVAYLRGTDVVFLEKGNENAGLSHILARHYQDFREKGFEADEIVPLLEYTIANLSPLNIVAGARGLSIEYAFDDRRYPELIHDLLSVAIGYNGFIVTALPRGLSADMGRLHRIADDSGN